MWLLAVLTACATACAWLMPLTNSGAFLMVVGSIGLVLLARAPLPLYLCGCLTYLAAFWWLAPTISTFSGLPQSVSVVLFLGFCLVSALQYPLYGWLARLIHTKLPLKGIGIVLSAPVAWFFAELVFFRIFPWTPAHALLPYREFVQLAGWISASGLTFVLFFLISLLVSRRTGLSASAITYAAVLATVAAIHFVGANRISTIEAALASARTFNLTLVQGNIPVLEKVDASMVTRNIRRYIELSRQTQARPTDEIPDLIVWPETVILDPLPRDMASLPGLAAPVSPILLGSIMFSRDQRGRDQFFNSAFVVAPKTGVLSAPYDKRILVPYGEYTPLGDLFPWMRELNQNAAEFVPGPEQTVLTVTTPDGESIAVAPLICYEDVVPGPALEAQQRGAQLLVNMSNDGWFGFSQAAKQHHQIASFRAIETGLPLVRVTNTGFTAVVDPTGATVASLPEHSAGVLDVRVAVR